MQMRLSFRKKFNLHSSRPKNENASALFQAMHDESEAYVEANPNAPPASLKTSQKALKALQKNLVELPVAGKLEVRLANMPLADAGITVLTKALMETKTARSLSLVKCGIDGESINTFAKLVHALPNLDEVNFSENTLSNSGTNVLLASMNPTSPVPVLILQGIGITDEGISSAFNVMTTTRTGFFIDLSRNTFSPGTIDRLIATAKKNTFVVGIEIEGTGATEAQSKQLAEVLARNQAVTESIEKLLVGACRRTFKTKLVTFRESVQQTKLSDDSVETSTPVYKWIQKAKSTNTMDIPSQRFQVGVCTDVGRRNEMQDVVTIKGMFRGDKNQDFFGLFDGHGGRDAASHCAERLPLLMGEFLFKSGEDVTSSIKDAFQKCNKEMSPWSTMMGTTAVIVLMINNKRYIANLGDSKAVLSQRGQVAFATQDHKATDPVEQQRVIDLGGQVIDGRINEKLSVARALGDSNLSPFVSAVPDVFEQTISKLDEFIILASDGVWDVMTPAEAVALIVNRQKKSSFSEPDSIEAKLLAELIKDEAYLKGSKDNISVLVILFPGFARLRRPKKKGDLLLASNPGGKTGVTRSPSNESHASLALNDVDPLYTTSDSELPTRYESDDDDDLQSTKKFVRTAMDDSVLDKIKSQYSDLPTTPIANSFRSEVLGELSNITSRDSTF